MDEVGPFRFMRNSEKYKVRFSGDTVTYSVRFFYDFIETSDDDLPDLETKITTMNMGYQLLLSTFRSWGSTEEHLVPLFTASKVRALQQVEVQDLLQEWRESYPQGQLWQMPSRILLAMEEKTRVHTAEQEYKIFFNSLAKAIVKDPTASKNKIAVTVSNYWRKGLLFMNSHPHFQLFKPQNMGYDFNPLELDAQISNYIWNSEFDYSIFNGLKWYVSKWF